MFFYSKTYSIGAVCKQCYKKKFNCIVWRNQNSGLTINIQHKKFEIFFSNALFRIGWIPILLPLQALYDSPSECFSLS